MILTLHATALAIFRIIPAHFADIFSCAKSSAEYANGQTVAENHNETYGRIRLDSKNIGSSVIGGTLALPPSCAATRSSAPDHSIVICSILKSTCTLAENVAPSKGA